MNGAGAVLVRIRDWFEVVIVVVLQLIMMIVIALAVFELCVLLYQGVRTHMFDGVSNIHELQGALQRAFAGMLLVLLGLELFETMKTYFTSHQIKLQVILIVAIIAVGRHIMLLDFEHAPPLVPIGVALLMLALTAGYFLVGRSPPVRAHDEQAGPTEKTKS